MRPDYSFAFKFFVYQSFLQSTVYDATLIVQLSAFYMLSTASGHYNCSLHPYINQPVTCTTPFSLSGAAMSTSYLIFRVPGRRE